MACKGAAMNSPTKDPGTECDDDSLCEIDGCIHGVPWDEDCEWCEAEEDESFNE